ncbi:MAG: hypothetical protein HND52_19760 [Ignavibacteriae bacterium]|nr:hypothetical protein [Ignavibacteriota bacterium]NOH00205.1 hypothetical protein [Ignavibacteriota bacterium]
MSRSLNLLIFFLMISSTMFSQSIFLKKSFFSGYKYSTDSISYVDLDVDNLEEIMSNNEESLDLLNSYTTNSTVSKIFGYPGGFLIGWPLGGYLGSGGEWKDGYTTMLIVGGGLTLVSIIFESIADNKLEESVSKYNSTNSVISKVQFGLGYCKESKNFSIAIQSRL